MLPDISLIAGQAEVVIEELVFKDLVTLDEATSIDCGKFSYSLLSQVSFVTLD